jgi:raffinose/stachyose/melibiose transport system substrate-binding protein
MAPAAAATATTAPATTSKASGKVTVWGWPTGVILGVVDSAGKDILVDTFKQDTGLDLDLQRYDFKDYGPALKTALPAGTGPDAILTDWDAVGPVWDFIQPIEDRAKAEWGANWRDKFTTAALGEMDLVSADHTLYLPANMQVLGWPLYWIADFEKAGVKAADIKKWDDLAAAADKLKAAGLLPFLSSGANWQVVDWFQSLVEVTAPGKIEKVQRGQGKFTDSDVVDAFKLYAKVHKDWTQPGVAGAEASVPIDGFQQHKSAMVMAAAGTPWFGFLSSDNAEVKDAINTKWSTFRLPGSKGLAATDCGLAMVKGAKNPDGAWEYVKWASTGHGAQLQSKNRGDPMGFKSISPSKQNTPFDQNLGGPLLSALQDPAANKFRRILSPDTYQALSDTLPGLVSDQLSADDAASEVQKALDKSFQGNGKKWLKP